jgi:hypothetical protein
LHLDLILQRSSWRQRIGRHPERVCAPKTAHRTRAAVIASEAKQSMAPFAATWIASSLPLLAMTLLVQLKNIKR